MKRAPTNGNGIGKFAVEETEPLEPPEGTKPRGRPMIPKKPSKTGDSLLDALNNAITVSDRAFEVFEKAVCGHKIGAMSTLLSVHNKAAEARVKLEKAYREEQERRGILVDKQVMLEICRRTMEPVLRRLKKLGSETGPECIGDDPLKSVKIIDIAVAKIIAIGRQALEDAAKS